MTEAEWLACDDPMPMLDYLWEKGTERQYRLFVVGCCRRIWGRLARGTGRIKSDEPVWHPYGPESWRETSIQAFAPEAAELIADDDAGTERPLAVTGDLASCAHAAESVSYMTANCGDEPDDQVASLRCIFGNPFRPPPSFDPSWRTPAVAGIAGGIYAERAFDRLPVLADALEEAGCEDPDLLAHLRGGGVHVRGCWALDLVMGK